MAAVVLAVCIYLLSTRRGIGLWPDSVGYLQLGVIRHFSPLYTWILKALESAGLDILAAAKFLGLVIVAANSWLVWRAATVATGATAPSLFATALIILSPLFVLLHALAMTEPLFLMMTLCALLIFARGAAANDRRLLVLAGAVVGASMLARFAGAASLGALCLAALVAADRPRLTRLIDAVAMGAAGSLVFLSWAFVSQLTTGQSTGRELAFNGNVDAERIRNAIDAAATAIVPPVGPPFLSYAVLAAVLAATAFVGLRLAAGKTWSRLAPGARAVIAFCGMFVVVYPAFIALSVSIEANLPINGRYLFPLYVFWTLGVVAAFAALDHTTRPLRLAGLAIVALGAGVILAHAARMAGNVAAAFNEGVGYAAVEWKKSPIMKSIAGLPEGATIYTNGPDAVAAVLRRCADYIPVKLSRFTGKEQVENPYAAQLARMDADLDREDVYVAFIDEISWRFYLPSEGEILEGMSLTLIADEGAGRIYARLPADRRRDPRPVEEPQWRPGFGGCTCAVIETGKWPKCR